MSAYQDLRRSVRKPERQQSTIMIGLSLDPIVAEVYGFLNQDRSALSYSHRLQTPTYELREKQTS